MPDILVVKCRAIVSSERLQAIYDCLKTQKESGMILLPPYLDAQVVPDDVEIKLVDKSEIYFIPIRSRHKRLLL